MELSIFFSRKIIKNIISCINIKNIKLNIKDIDYDDYIRYINF